MRLLERITANVNRSRRVLHQIDTDVLPGDFTQIRFRVGDELEVDGLNAAAGDEGVVEVDVTIPANALDFPPGNYIWELLALHGGEQVTLGKGKFILHEEPTTAPEEPE